jgi:hypothetical protein
MVWLMSISPSKRKDKRYTAVFCRCKTKDECKGKNNTTTHFGQKNATTFIDGATDKTKSAYLARHRVSGNWSDPTTASSLSRYILWGSKPNFRDAVAAFKNKFKL